MKKRKDEALAGSILYLLNIFISTVVFSLILLILGRYALYSVGLAVAVLFISVFSFNHEELLKNRKQYSELKKKIEEF